MYFLKKIFFCKRLFFWLGVFWFLLLAYAIWSYSQVDPNLVLTTLKPYWIFQNWIWQFDKQNPILSTQIYVFLVLTLFVVYTKVIFLLSQLKLKTLENFSQAKRVLLAWLLVITPLLFSYNALSHDVFNYIFNAKMVVMYHVDPHVKVALDFPLDQWTRFMHNTHTSAPYYYGWTGLSLLPYSLGFGKFLLTWLQFRFFALLSLVLLYFVIYWFLKKLQKTVKIEHLSLLFLNPLVLIEIFGNSHNDVWMMSLALLALSLVLGKVNKLKAVLSLVLLLLSVSIKYATVLLLPVWLVFLFLSWFKLSQKYLNYIVYILGLSSVAFFALLLLERSRQFLPWYLTWSLVWLPLISSLQLVKPQFKLLTLFLSRLWPSLVLAFSLSALLRYVPWLLTGEYSMQITALEKMITWGLGISAFLLLNLFKVLKTLLPDRIKQ